MSVNKQWLANRCFAPSCHQKTPQKKENLFESLYKGASVFLLASVTDVMELVMYDGEKY